MQVRFDAGVASAHASKATGRADSLTGLTLVDDITTAAHGLRNGDWLSASLGT